MKELILAYQGEMTLKGLTRGSFRGAAGQDHPLAAGAAGQV